LRHRAAGDQIEALPAVEKGSHAMIEEPAEPRRRRGQALIEIAREDLDLYAVEELQERIDQLQAEIVRTKTQLDRKQAGRAAADALFKR
jgi:uncharacterized small protein (DUF1192 family)